ncbi:MAG: hypothetical protein ACI35R_00485 [Bacillus sp. (in: firmicutes)]
MEKLLRKSAIYGFFVGIGAGILLVKYRQVEHFNGGYSTSYVPIADYIIPVLRWGVVAAVIGLLCGLYLYNQKKKGETKIDEDHQG